jgi:hypothetical protein
MANRQSDGATIDPRDALAHNTAQRYKAYSDYKGVLDERGNALIEVNEKSGPRSKAYNALEEKVKREDSQLVKIKSAVRRPLSRWQVRTWVIVLVGFGLALLEAPANKFLFDVALQSSGVVSYAVSAGVTAFLLFLAHFAGRSIRQIWSDFRHRVIVSSVLVFVLCIGAAAVIIGVLTVARAAFASQGGTIGDLMSGIQDHITSYGPLGALFAALSDTSALVLACINLGGFVTAFVIAFFSHDSDRDFDHAQSAVDHLEKQMNKVHTAYLRDRSAVIKKYTPDLVGFAGTYTDANGKIVQLKTRMSIPLDEDDRFVLTDLDQLAEDADRRYAADAYGPEVPTPSPGGASIRVEPVVSLKEHRRSTGTEP